MKIPHKTTFLLMNTLVLACLFSCQIGCTGTTPGATAPANVADFPGEDTQDGGRSRAAKPIDVDQREEEEGG